jgi:hypothetical protein
MIGACFCQTQKRVIDRTTEGADEHLKKLTKRHLGIGKYYYRNLNHKRIILKIKPEKVMRLAIYPALFPCIFYMEPINV